jgi:Capsule assembly protein Wzi
MRKIIYYLTFILLVIISLPLTAQNLLTGMPVIEDGIRFQQLAGVFNKDLSFTIRPIAPGAASYITDFYHGEKNYSNSTLSQFIQQEPIKNWSKRKFSFQLLPIGQQLQYNSHHPYGPNPGPMVPNKGIQTMFSGGFYAVFKNFEFQFRPEFVYASNDSFNSPKYRLDQSGPKFDLPERFGYSAVKRTAIGQTALRFRTNQITLALSTENMWWGPGIKNSLVLTDNADGFAHASITSTKPLSTFFGKVEFEATIGRLTSSPYYLTKDTGKIITSSKPDRNAVFTGYIVSIQPNFLKGLFFGLISSHVLYQDQANSLSSYLPLKIFRTNAGTSEPADDKLSFFTRFLMPSAKAEVYFEWAREDNSQDLQDLVQATNHTRAYIIGGTKMFPLSKKSHFYISAEVTQLEKPLSQWFRNTTPSWYINWNRSYTNNGQVLGAEIGPGSNLQTIRFGFLRDFANVGLEIERKEVNNDVFYRRIYPLTYDDNRKWVEMSGAFYAKIPTKHFLFDANVRLIQSYYFNWEYAPNAVWSGFRKQGNNPKWVSLNLGCYYRL